MGRKLLAPAYCDPCPCGKIKGICVYYTGVETPNLGIKPDTNLNEVIKIIDAAQQSLSPASVTAVARAAITLTTNGTGGPATYNFVTGVLNIPVYSSEGTVTLVDSNDLAPLFTTSVTTPDTTPVINYSLSQANANTYWGNNSGIAATPSYIQAGALLKSDDTNVTLTLGGNPTTSLLRSVSLNLGWQGTLSLGRGGTATALSDPNADKIMFWDDSVGAMDWLDLTTGLKANNGLYHIWDGATHTTRLGGTLIENTTINTQLFQLILTGNTIYEAPFQVDNIHDWINGTGLWSWKGTNKLFYDLVPGPPNFVKLSVNYTEDIYATNDENEGGGQLPGYFGDRIGYFLSTNLTGHGSFGQYIDDLDSKSTGIFFHTMDDGTDGVTIFAVPNTEYLVGPPNTLELGLMADWKVLTAHTNLDLQFWGYPNTRDDGTPVNILGTDANGIVQSYPAASAGAGTAPIVILDNGTSLTLDNTGSFIKTYVFTGSTDAIWTMPAIGTSGQIIKVKNRGTANVTLQTAGSDEMYTNAEATSINVLTGDAFEFQDDSVYWILNG